MVIGRPSNPIDEILKFRAERLIPGVTSRNVALNTGGLGGRGIPANLTSYSVGTDIGGLLGPINTERALTQEEVDLQTTKKNAIMRILSDPNASANSATLLAELEKVAAGEKPSAGGIGGQAAKGFGAALGGLGYVLGRPLAVVASAAKELTDAAQGQKSSFSDFIEQALAPDTAMSKYIPKTGNKWLDGIIGFGADVAFDPLTYVTFGASAYAGRAGRLKLAAKAAEAENLAKAPSLLAKINDGSIARLGEWALTSAEKKALGIRSGVSWQYGAKNVIGREGTATAKVSQAIAGAVGKPFALGRAKLGDAAIFRPLQKATTTASARNAGLTMYGRAKDAMEGVDVIAKLGAYSSAARAQGAGRLISGKFGATLEKLVAQVSEYEASTGRKIQEVIEGSRRATDGVERTLADNISKFLSDVRADMNASSRAISGRRGINISQIGFLENYVPHTLTAEAKDYLIKNGSKNNGLVRAVRDMLGMSAGEFVGGPSVLQARTLKTGDKFFGKTLKTEIGNTGYATMSEINQIVKSRTGFNLFEEDAAKYLKNYLDSAVDQTKRISFVDRLFDYGPDVVRKYTQKVIPDKVLRKEYESTLNLIASLTDDLFSDFAATVSKDIDDLLAPRLAMAKAIADSEPGAKLLKPERISQVQETLGKIVANILKADNIAQGSSAEVRTAYEAMMEPLRNRVADLQSFVSGGMDDALIAETSLKELYQRVFPAADLPDLLSPKQMAEDIVDGIEALRGNYDLADEATDLANKIGQMDEASALLESEAADLARIQGASTAAEGLTNVGEQLPGRMAADAASSRIAKIQQELADIASTRQTDLDELSRLESEALSRGEDVADIIAKKKKVARSADRRIASRQKKLPELQSIVDAGGPLDVAKAEWDAGVGQVYRDTIDDVMELIAQKPKKGASGDVNAAWVKKTMQTLDALNAPGLALTPVERDVLERLFVGMRGMEAWLGVFEQTSDFASSQLAKVMAGELGDAKFVDDILKGWQKIESMGIQMPPEVRDVMFDRVRSLKDPTQISQFKKMYEAYTKFFKVTAMLTPGFIVRNSYTASFNNFVAGVSYRETFEGLRFATNMWRKGPEFALSKVPTAKRGLYERALQVAFASGAGQTADDILAPVLSSRGRRLLDRRPIKTWSNANEAAEVAARFSLALSSLNRGMDYDAALNNVVRYHFDYTDLSQFDEFMRQWIPFWTFASRNIPLQLVNKVARPSLYRRYEALQRNFGVSEEDNTVFPSWLKERQPLQFPGMGPGSVINPDLPFIDMQEQARMFSDPLRLLSQANPLVKLPIELAGGRQLYQDIPFKQDKYEVRGPLDWPAYIAGLLTGSSGTRPDGSTYTSQRVAYAVPNLAPTLATLQRLLPQFGGKESYQDRQGSSVASFFGLPYRRVSQQEQTNELLRRQFAIKNYLSNMTRSGYLAPKEGT